MGQSLIGIIPSDLTPEEILDLPGKLNNEKPLGIPGEDWHWEVPDMSVDFLRDYWTWDEQWYISEMQNQRYDKIYKYPSIETSGLQWRILFFEPKLISIEFPLKYSLLEDLQPIAEVIDVAIRLAKFFKQNKMVLTYELGSGSTQEELTGADFGTISKAMESFRLTKRDFKLIEF
jgi:hypothetical protein